MPLIMTSIDPAQLPLNDGQMQAIGALREDFLDQIGGPNQDASDPGYRRRWQKAQPSADDELRGLLGISAWEGLQLQQYYQAQASSAPNGSP